MVLDQGSRRDDPRDFAFDQLVGLRHFELVGQGDDVALRDQAREVLREGVVRHAGHRHAPSRAGFFTRQRDL